MKPATIRVFEHERIAIGAPLRAVDGTEVELTEAHHRALAAFADRTEDRFFSCGRKTVRFSQYVGFLQVNDLGIEVLPKVDRADSDTARWHGALLRMLRVAGDVSIDAPDIASLETQTRSLLEVFVRRLIRLTDALLHEGLAKGYRTVEENRGQFRGRLLVAQHVRHNVVRQDRFYVAHPVFDHAIVPTLILSEALHLLRTIPLSSAIAQDVRRVHAAFPELPRWRPTREALETLHLGRSTARYKEALQIARLLLTSLGPNLSAGREPLLALLFDMNTLWESYVAALAKRLKLPGIRVRSQDSRAFWKTTTNARRYIRPDITLYQGEQCILVIDTKWKAPRDDRPKINDLRQMFAYNELFETQRAMLLYPSAGETRRGPSGAFVGKNHECETAFLSVDDSSAGLRSLLVATSSAIQQTPAP